MKKLLFVVSVYRQGERIHPIIPSLSEKFDISLLSVHQMNFKHHWNGDIDLRKEFHKKYDSYFSKIYDNWQYVDYSQFDIILFDDSRDKGTEIPTKIIYPIAKDAGAVVFGNQHGNNKFTSKSYEVDHYKQVFDYCFLLGRYERDIFSKFVDKNAYLLGGIPSNDVLKNYKRTNENILVITNFLENERRMFPTFFGDDFVKKIKLYDLQQKYGKRVIVKIKSRDRHFALGNLYTEDINFVKSVLKNNSIEGDVLRDVKDDNLMISSAYCVVGAPSTMCFKSIQLGIPTVILDGSGYIGAYENFYGFKPYGEIENNIDNQVKRGRDTEYINYNIEGGVDYNSIDVYINSLVKILER
ncbi:hypothetical protein CL614_08270 [archaeon]|nr:hypothetical protein [archaeon]|tara:strand:+ start:400 stop:1464 length:1065 start_codon:yes stop_codon:yes gene_type:complete